MEPYRNPAKDRILDWCLIRFDGYILDKLRTIQEKRRKTDPYHMKYSDFLIYEEK